jgi:uncharacterized CHY-type Zn-finger protein
MIIEGTVNGKPAIWHKGQVIMEVPTVMFLVCGTCKKELDALENESFYRCADCLI